MSVFWEASNQLEFYQKGLSLEIEEKEEEQIFNYFLDCISSQLNFLLISRVQFVGRY